MTTKSLLLLATLLPFSALSAQTSALKGLDTGAPIDVDAARIEIQDAANQAVFSGAVIIRQGKLTLNADSVKVLYSRDKAGNPEMQRLDARGHVKLVSPSERATGNTGIYDVSSKIITLTAAARRMWSSSRIRSPSRGSGRGCAARRPGGRRRPPPASG